MRQIPWEAMATRLEETAQVAVRVTIKRGSVNASKDFMARPVTKCPPTFDDNSRVK